MSGWGSMDYDNQDEEGFEDENEFETKWTNKDSIVFAIDCSPSMFQVVNDETPFNCALKCVSSLLQDKIISSESDSIGVIFFGVKRQSNTVPSFEGIHIFQDLDVPDAKGILDVEDLMEERVDFDKVYGHGSFQISNLLWATSIMFSNSGTKGGTRRVFLFTNEDNPHAGDHQAMSQAKTKAKDLADLGIEVELFSLNKQDEAFDIEKFYSDIITLEEDEVPDKYPDSSKKLNELLERVRRKEFKKRTVMRLPFKLTENMEISVRVYNMIMECKKGTPVHLDSKDNEIVKPVTKYTTVQGVPVSTKEMKSYYEFGGEKIVFEKEEIDQIKDFGPPVLLLLGFKPRESLKRKHAIRHSSFIYPNEQDVTGSNLVFHSLLLKLHEMDKIAICKLIPRVNSAPRLVALLPQIEELDENNVQMNPPGFHMIFLPFSDDLRHLVFPKMPKANEDQIQAARKVVSRLELKNFNCKDFENPVLQAHYATLQALALNRDQPDEVIDYTLPAFERIAQRTENETTAWNSEVYPEGYVPQADIPKPKATKRTISGDDETSNKKAKKEGLSEDEIKAYIDDGRLVKLTIPQLKQFLESVRLKVGGNKGELMERITNYFKTK